jgi:heterotetrameric sarcosine oxidase delta subunit
MRITCPFCGPRDEAEFAYRGDATVTRPAPDAGEAAFAAYLYERANPKGWHVQWFQHAQGCRQWLKVERHTVTHEIRSVVAAAGAAE